MSEEASVEASLSPPELEFVEIPVPKHRVLEVYGYLAHVEDGGSAEGTVSLADEAAPAAPEGGPKPYDEATLRRLWDESEKPMKRVLKYLADKPGQAVTTEELGQAVADLQVGGWEGRGQKGPASIAGMFGALSRRCGHRYKRPMPFDSGWGGVTMPPEIAEVIKSF